MVVYNLILRIDDKSICVIYDIYSYTSYNMLVQ